MNVNEIINKANEYVSQYGDSKIKSIFFSKEDNSYLFLFKEKNGEDFPECVVINADSGKLKAINMLKLMIGEEKLSTDYEQIELATAKVS